MKTEDDVDLLAKFLKAGGKVSKVKIGKSGLPPKKRRRKRRPTKKQQRVHAGTVFRKY